MKNKFYKYLVVGALALPITATTVYSFTDVSVVHAENEDGVQQGGGYDALRNVQQNQNQNVQQGVQSNTQQSNAGDVQDLLRNATQRSNTNSSAVDMLKGQQGVTSESMSTARGLFAPVQGPISIGVSFIFWLVFMSQFLITALDTLYIKLPFTRSFLVRENQVSTQNANTPKGRQWVSDECLQAVAIGQGSTNQMGRTQGMGSSYGGYGSSMMGGYGGSMMGGYGTSPQEAQQGNARGVMTHYIKLRAVAMIALGIMFVLLTSSFFTDAGIDVGLMFLRWFEAGKSWVGLG